MISVSYTHLDVYKRQDGEIICREDGEEIRVCPVSELQIIGRHNYENAMAAVLIARALSVPFEIITPALKQFAPVEHRIERCV